MSKKQKTSGNLKAISLCGAIALMSGCGGSSDDSNTSEQQTNNSNSGARYIPEMPYSPKSYSTNSLTENNAEAVVKNVAQVVSYLVEEYGEFAETPVVEIYQDTSYDIALSDTAPCSISGTQALEMNAPAQLRYYDYRVWGAGDRFKNTYIECADDTAGSTIYVSGSHELNMVSGVYDNFSIYASPSEFTFTYDKLGFYSYGTQHSFRDGTFTFNATDSSVGFSSDKFTQVARVPYETIGFTAHNIDFEINRAQGTNSFSEAVVFTHEGSLTLDLDSPEIRVTLDIPGELLEDRWLGYDFISGEIHVTSSVGRIIMEFQDGYLDYSVDEDNDGIAETTGTLDDRYY